MPHFFFSAKAVRVSRTKFYSAFVLNSVLLDELTFLVNSEKAIAFFCKLIKNLCPQRPILINTGSKLKYLFSKFICIDWTESFLYKLLNNTFRNFDSVLLTAHVHAFSITFLTSANRDHWKQRLWLDSNGWTDENWLTGI